MKKQIASLALTTLAACLLITPSASAQETTQAEAERLKALFQNVLDKRQARYEADADNPRTLKLEGEVTVEPADTHYAITLPSIEVVFDDGRRENIGIIVLNATPHEKPGQLKMTMALPTPMVAYDETGTEVTRIEIGEQQSSGIWHEELGKFIKLDSSLSNTTIKMPDVGGTVKIPQMRATYDFDQTESGRWSGPATFDFRNISIEGKEDHATGKLAALTITSKLDELAPEIFDGANDQPETSAVRFADGVSFNVALKGLDVSRTGENGEPEKVSLALGGLNFSFDNALQSSVDAQFGLSFDGFLTTNTPKDVAELLPKSGRIDIINHNLPLGQLAPMVENSTGAGQAMGLSLLFKVPAILAQAGSYLEIKEISATNHNYNMVLDALVRADLTAVNSATANGTLKFAGLDKVLSLTQVAGTNLNSSKYATTLRTIARFLERLKPMAQVETDDKWGFVHVFNFEMNEKGQTLINGQDSATLQNQATPPPAVETTPLSPAQNDL